MAEIQSQKWARLAYGHMTKAERQTRKDEYGGQWMRLPYLVMTNGLSQAVAFFASKTGDDHKPEFQWVLDDLREILGLAQNANVQQSVQGFTSTRDYSLATRKVIDASIWYKRYAEGIFGLNLADDNARGGH